MKQVVITRGFHNSEATVGILQIQGVDHIPIFTLERAWRDNAANVSCIPRGVYMCEPFSGQKYKDVYQLKDVPNRTYILIHVGNHVKHSKGCILVGLMATTKDGDPAVYSSRAALDELKKHLGSEPFELSIF